MMMFAAIAIIHPFLAYVAICSQAWESSIVKNVRLLLLIGAGVLVSKTKITGSRIGPVDQT